VGIAQRAERILLVGLFSLLVGAGPHALLLEGIVALLAAASVVTVVQRFVYVFRHADAPRVPSPARDAAVPLDTLAKGR
jgi:hypothetical protein